MDPMCPVKSFPNGTWRAIPSLPNKKPRGTEMSTSKSWDFSRWKMGFHHSLQGGPRLPNDTWSDHPICNIWSDPYQWALAVIHAVMRDINVITPVPPSNFWPFIGITIPYITGAHLVKHKHNIKQLSKSHPAQKQYPSKTCKLLVATCHA